MIRPLLQVPNPILFQRSEPITLVTMDERMIGNDLLETMRKHHALGLSAVQIGVLKRIIVVNPRSGFPFLVLFNPEIISKVGPKVSEREGCMSVAMGSPNVRFEVSRWSTVRVKFTDRAGVDHEVNAHGTAARVLQHEIDHLDGVVIGQRVAA